jgi:hypothetical protein
MCAFLKSNTVNICLAQHWPRRAVGCCWRCVVHACQRTALNWMQTMSCRCDAAMAQFSIQHTQPRSRCPLNTHTRGFARRNCRMTLYPRTTMGASRTSLMGIALSPAILSQSCVSQITEEEVNRANRYDKLTHNVADPRRHRPRPRRSLYDVADHVRGAAPTPVPKREQ